jgi:hypothetical protein
VLADESFPTPCAERFTLNHRGSCGPQDTASNVAGVDEEKVTLKASLAVKGRELHNQIVLLSGAPFELLSLPLPQLMHAPSVCEDSETSTSK